MRVGQNSTVLFCLVLVSLLASQSQLAAQQEVVSGTPDQDGVKKEFLRLTRDNSGNLESLETSVTRYRSDDGKILVDLIGVIHIGEAEYYRRLQRQFSQYDSLLYELVAPEGKEVPGTDGGSGTNPLSLLQGSMQKMLGLESQLKRIDYSKSNFVHADLSPEEIGQRMAERGETPWTLGLKALSELMEQQNRKGNAAGNGQDIGLEDLMDMLSDPLKLKQMLASQFVQAGTAENGLGKSLNRLLVTDRNQAAIKVLKQELESGKTRIGIFYGAAHMADFDQRLTEQFGLHQTRQVWVQAWDLKKAPKGSTPSETVTGMVFQFLENLEK